MSSKTLVIYEYKALFKILNEIREKLNFEILELNNKDLNNFQSKGLTNFLIVSSKHYENLSNCLVIDNIPIRINKLIEYLNISFLKNNFANQSELRVGKYTVDLNSRQIKLANKKLSLTERETELILFINSKKIVNIKELQKNVWGYSNNLETHTVETHIYRLRKKMQETFDDDDFIKYEKNGYSIN